MSKRRTGEVLTAAAVSLMLVGAAMYVLPGPGLRPHDQPGRTDRRTRHDRLLATAAGTATAHTRSPAAMTWQWIGLVFFSVTLLPAYAATLLDAVVAARRTMEAAA
ncbi:hypothetical protein GCM10020367_60330 [Streptomyces sannanensis]|uniref:Uncharacterized protein n=1 Tax=Streptomyces sannanensis TaxID=285536 RepID=A0ABP6SL29_9ACTN